MKSTYLLFGEFIGETMQNNSFYTWKKAIHHCKAYFVYKKNEKNDGVIKNLSSYERKFIVEFDSKKHIEVFNKSEMLFVSLSNMDVIPSSISTKLNRKPIIYLQHGILGMKKIYYTSTSYNNYLFRFVYFNKAVRESLEKENFEPYQLEHMPYQPRYVGLYEKEKQYSDNGSLLTFITWREEGNLPIIKMLNDLDKLKYDGEKKIILHDFIDINDLPKFSNITIYRASEVDVQKMLCECNKFITDFSSVIWDAAFLGKNVYLYSPDYYSYYKSRDTYIEKEQIDSCLSLNLKDLENNILEDSKNTYFHENIGQISEFNDVFIDAFIEKMLNIIDNKIVFIGYGFYGIGGTITATKAIAQRLLKKDKLIEFYSLTKNGNDRQVVPGLILKYNFDWQNHSAINGYLSKVKPSKYFTYDQNNDPRAFNAFSEYRFKKYLKSLKCATVISTREAYHYYVNKFTTCDKKIYIFNTDYKLLEDLSPGIVKTCEKINIENAIFVSDNSMELYHNNTIIKPKNSFVVPNLLFIPMEKKRVIKTAVQYYVDDFKINDNKAVIHFYLSNEIFVDENVNVGIKLVSDSITVNTETNILHHNSESKYSAEVYCTSSFIIENFDSFVVESYNIELSILQNNFEIIKPINDVSHLKNSAPLIFVDPSISKMIYFDELSIKFIDSKINEVLYETLKLDKKQSYDALYKRVCCAFRISLDRMQYIEDLIKLGNEIKNKKVDIIIDIYGSGNAFDIFKNKINMSGLEKILYLKGHSNDILEVTREYDIQISLSKTETFGMTYIEGIMTGKKVFTYKNEGSLELFKEHTFALCDGNEEIIEKIVNSDNYKFDEVYKKFVTKYLETEDINIFL